MKKNTDENYEYKQTYRKIKNRFILAVIVILALLTVSELIIQKQFNYGESMSRVISVAGKQVMIGQNISEDVIKLYQNSDIDKNQFFLEDLKLLLVDWNQLYSDLKNGNIEEGLPENNGYVIKHMYLELDESFRNISNTSHDILNMYENKTYDKSLLIEKIKFIQNNESIFQDQMNHIIYQYNNEGKGKLQIIRKIELFLFFSIFIILSLMTVYIFYPVNKTIQKLFESMNNSNENVIKLFKTLHGSLFLVYEENAEILLMNTDAERLINIDNNNNNNNNKDKIYNLIQDVRWLSVDFEKLYEKMRRMGKIDDLEVDIIDNKDNDLTVILSSVKGDYKGRPIILISLYDITIQKKAEDAMKNLAMKDELTGLYNRHFLDAIVYEEVDRSERYETPLSTIIFDLDHFKKINDRWGHPVGDSVLQLVAKVVNDNLRISDYLIRIGGEEFVIIMPHTNIAGAHMAAEKIRRAIELNKHPIAGKYTASFGVAERVPGETYRSLYKRMDDALYQAKESGRNCVVESAKLGDGYTSVSLHWKDSWNSDENKIDEQHKELFQIANQLINLSYTADEMEKALEQLDLLMIHIKEHFKYEENILSQVKYSDYLYHKNIHMQLLNKGKKLRESYATGELNLATVFAFTFNEIIIGHLINEDVKFYSFIKEYNEQVREGS